MNFLKTSAKINKLAYQSSRSFAASRLRSGTSAAKKQFETKDSQFSDTPHNAQTYDNTSSHRSFSAEAGAQSPYYTASQEDSYTSRTDNNSYGRSDSSFGRNPSDYQSSSYATNTQSLKDPISATLDLAGAMAENARQFVQTAGNTAQEIAERVTGTGRNYSQPGRQSDYRYDNYRSPNDNYNYNRRPASDDPINNTAQNISDTMQAVAQGAANTVNATFQGLASIASSFIPGAPPTGSDRNFNTGRYQDRNDYSRSYNRGPEMRSSPEYFTSQNPQFTSFNASGPASGFNQQGDFSSTARNFVDNTAQNIKSFADQAAGTAKDFVDRGFSNTAQNMASSTVKGFADSAYDIASRFAPNNQYQARSANNYRYNDYQRRPNDNTDQNIIGNVVESAFQTASDMARGAFNVANSIGSSFIPNSRGDMNYNQGNMYNQSQSYSDQFVNNFSGVGTGPQFFISTNPQFNSFSIAAPGSGFGNARMANDFASSAKNMVDDTISGFNDFASQAQEGVKDFVDRSAEGMRDFADRNAPYNSGYGYATNRGGSRGPSPGEMVGDIVNAAGTAFGSLATGLFSIASSFVPTAGNPQNMRDDSNRYGFQGGSYNNRF